MEIADYAVARDVVLEDREEQEEEVIHLVVIPYAVVQQVRVVIKSNDAAIAQRTVMRSQRSPATTVGAHRACQLLVLHFLAQQTLTLVTLHVQPQIAGIADAR